MVWRYQRSNQHPKSKKNIQHNDRKKKDKRINNDIQDTSNSQNKRDKQWWTKQSAYDLRCSDVNYGCCIMKWTYFRVIIRSVKDFFFYYWMSFWTLFQLFIFFQSTQWKRTATNKLSYVLLYRIDNPIERNCIHTWSVDRQWL